jgi:hypothetical protein
VAAVSSRRAIVAGIRPIHSAEEKYSEIVHLEKEFC